MFAVVFIIVLLSSLLASTLIVGKVQAATEVSGNISTDTTWTKANSPYNLTGNVLVESGVTLTIEPGVAVDLLGFEDGYPVGYDLTVEGTLIAIGSNSEPIHFGNGSITFEQSSTSWDEQDGSGCIIENALLNVTLFINSASPKIHNNSIFANLNIYGGSPVISDNTIIPPTGYTYNIQINDGSPVILDNVINCHLRISGGSPVIYSNMITLINSSFEEAIGVTADFPVISNNIIESTTKIAVRINSGTTSLLNNIIQGGNEVGVSLRASPLAPNNASVSGNIISDCTVAGFEAVGYPYQYEYNAVIERNLIINNQNGMRVNFCLNGIVRENTITDNYDGLYFVRGQAQALLRSTFLNNNIYANSNYDVELQKDLPYEYDVDVTYNWWGTTDTQSISLKIFDSEDDPNLGTANSVPFLTEPNLDAPSTAYIPPLIPLSTLVPMSTPTPNPTAEPTPTPEPTPTSTPTSTPAPTPPALNLLEIAILVGLVVTAVLLVVIIGLVLKKRR